MRLCRYILLTLAAILLTTSCGRKPANHGQDDSDLVDDTFKKPNNTSPELPYIMEGDYILDTGVIYKVILGSDTCFLTIESIEGDSIRGYYYATEHGDCATRRPFVHEKDWLQQKKDATVYEYKQPEYKAISDSRYRKASYKVKVRTDVVYGVAQGYWCSMPGTDNESYMEILSEGLKKSFSKKSLPLTLDIYLPDNRDTLRPLLLLLHGGGFYVGDKQDSAIAMWCRHFASLGYATASANYRMGFLPTKKEITRTGYMALQDAHAAMRFLVDNAKEYGIDTNMIFIGGASAGSITALNLAFMRDKNQPSAVRKKSGGNNTSIAGSGNDLSASFHIKAVANMWGAMTNLNMLKNSNTDIVSFHGDADQVVPYDHGYPFQDISSRLGSMMFDRMYGSVQIDKRARELGLRSVLYSFPGEGHSLHHNADGSWNQKNYEFIRDKMTDFFYNEIIGHAAKIESYRDNPNHFLVSGDVAGHILWHVEGGFVTKMSDNEIWVLWKKDAPSHKLYATGHYKNGIGFEVTQKIDI